MDESQIEQAQRALRSRPLLPFPFTIGLIRSPLLLLTFAFVRHHIRNHLPKDD